MKIAALLDCIGILMFLPSIAFADLPFTPQQRLDLLPIPAGAMVQQKADFAKDALVDFSKQHGNFTLMDPFSEANNHRPSSNDPILKFTTYSSPRMVYLFYWRFFNMEQLKPDAERKLPYYNARSTFAFDSADNADVTNDQSVGSAAFYRIEAGGKGELSIVIFNNGRTEQTTVYVISWQEPKA